MCSTKSLVKFSILALSIVFFVGCPRNSENVDGCQPGTTGDCTCPTTSGVRTCLPNRTYGPCRCMNDGGFSPDVHMAIDGSLRDVADQDTGQLDATLTDAGTDLEGFDSGSDLPHNDVELASDSSPSDHADERADSADVVATDLGALPPGLTCPTVFPPEVVDSLEENLRVCHATFANARAFHPDSVAALPATLETCIFRAFRCVLASSDGGLRDGGDMALGHAPKRSTLRNVSRNESRANYSKPVSYMRRDAVSLGHMHSFGADSQNRWAVSGRKDQRFGFASRVGDACFTGDPTCRLARYAIYIGAVAVCSASAIAAARLGANPVTTTQAYLACVTAARLAFEGALALCEPPDCDGGLICCSERCTDTRTDISNCGGCGNVCTMGLMCISGGCRCAAGQRPCGGRCVIDCETSVLGFRDDTCDCTCPTGHRMCTVLDRMGVCSPACLAISGSCPPCP